MEQKLTDDFPVDWEDDNYVSRREFFKFMTLASGGLAIGSTAMAAWASRPHTEIAFDQKPIGALADIPVGGSLQFTYPRDRDLCILVRISEENLVAYSRRCTHLSCPVEWEPSKQRLYCPCHNGAFGIEDGRVLQGPPPRPLPRIRLEVREGEVYAVGVTLRDEA